MTEPIFTIAKISVILFLLYKMFKKIAQISSPNPVMDLMKESMVISSGNLPSRRKD